MSDRMKVENVKLHTIKELIHKKIKVGQHGYIKLLDVMDDNGNGDLAIVNAARISYGDGTTRLRADEKLLRYLLRCHHTSVFEQVEIKFEIQCPIDVFRQMVRHRTFSFNEVSTRYSEAINLVEVLEPHEWRKQSTKNKQGSEGNIDLEDGEFLTSLEETYVAEARSYYEQKVEMGVSREVARKTLTLSNYTKVVCKVDGHNFMNFLRLRLDRHAQQEIRMFAEALAEIFKVWLPWTWKAFVDYRLEAVSFSRMEMVALKGLIKKLESLLPVCDEIDSLKLEVQDILEEKEEELSKREFGDLFSKIQTF